MESTRAFLVWQGNSPSPKLAFLLEDARFVDRNKAVATGLVASEDRSKNAANELASQYYDLHIDGKPYSKHAAYTFNIDTPLTDWTSKDAPSPDQLVVLDINKFPEVWEEDTRLQWGSVRNPYHRVDTVPTTRRVQVFAIGQDGKTKHLVADTVDTPTTEHVKALFETGYTTRWYLPASALKLGATSGTHVSPPIGTPSSGFGEDSKKTICPYKGRAYYHSVTLPDGEVLPDVAWSYPESFPTLDLRGLIAFWTPGKERLQLYIDGNLSA